MKIFLLELRKVLLNSSVWVFVGISVLVNIIFAVSMQGYGISASNDICDEELNIYNNYDCTIVYEHLQRIGFDPTALTFMEKKYEKLQPVIDVKAVNGDALDPYFGMWSANIHEKIFGGFGKLLFAEFCILSILMTLLLAGYENVSNTAMMVYTTKTGRKLIIKKFLSSLVASSLIFIIIYGVGWGFVFGINDFTGIWGQNVSSVNNGFNIDGFFGVPFTTWQSMTFKQYLVKSLSMSYLLGIVFTMLSFPLAVLMRNTFGAFWILAGINVVNVILIMVIPFTSPFYCLAKMTTFGIILYNWIWFTDGGSYFFLPHFETVITIFYAILAVLATTFAMKKFKRKDLI